MGQGGPPSPQKARLRRAGPLPPCFCVRDVGKGVTKKWRVASDPPPLRLRRAGEIGRTKGCTPGFLRKSAQPVGRTRDNCDPENERVCKSLKTRRDECKELVSRASEQSGKGDRGEVQANRSQLRTGLCPTLTDEHNPGMVTPSIVNYMIHSSNDGNKEGEAGPAGGAGTRLVAGEVVEVVHDGTAQMAEHEPEDSLENFFGCRGHAGRVSHAGTESRIIESGTVGATTP